MSYTLARFKETQVCFDLQHANSNLALSQSSRVGTEILHSIQPFGAILPELHILNPTSIARKNTVAISASAQ